MEWGIMLIVFTVIVLFGDDVLDIIRDVVKKKKKCKNCSKTDKINKNEETN